MARSFSNVKLISSLLADGFSLAINRRGISGVAQQGVATSVARAAGNKSGGEKATDTPWVPDPVTGFYRPENQVAEIDVAELRQILLNKPRHN